MRQLRSSQRLSNLKDITRIQKPGGLPGPKVIFLITYQMQLVLILVSSNRTDNM